MGIIKKAAVRIWCFVVEIVVNDLINNEKMIESLSEDLRKISLFLMCSGAIGYFTQREEVSFIRIDVDEARIFAVAGVLLYFLAMSILIVRERMRSDGGEQ